MAPVIGLTGGIGTGKSTVAAILAELGAHVIDADKIGHETYRPGSEGFARVAEAFGPGVVARDGSIDRRALGGLVFADADARVRLNAIVHPLIASEIARRLATARAGSAGTPIVIEAAILVEAGWRSLVDQLWTVSAPRATAIARVMATRGLTRAEAEQRVEAQLPDAERRRVSDRVIENDGTLEELRAQVEKAWQAI